MGLVLGLDIDIASIGWSVLDYDAQKIIRLGVRTFDKGEAPKDGSSPALPRRLARSARRRLRRRRQRLDNVREWLVKSGIANSEEEIKSIFAHVVQENGTPYQLRAEGLDRLLSREEWIRVLLHLAKRRGFKSNRRTEAFVQGGEKKDAKKEGELLSGVNGNTALLKEKGYRTAGEMLFKDEKYNANKRNKGGAYQNSLSRELIEQEARMLFEAQRKCGSLYAKSETEEEYLSILSFQRPFASADDILEKVRNCTFEPDKKRAPRNSYTAECFVLFSKLNNLRIYDHATKTKRRLTDEERSKTAALAWKNAKVTYSQVRKEIGLNDGDIFADLNYYDRKKKENLSLKDAEKATFVELKGYHAIKKALSKGISEDLWKSVKSGTDLLDEIALILTCEKSDDKAKVALSELFVKYQISTPDKAAEVLVPVSFRKFIHLSFDAMRKINPFLERGFGYEEACEKAGYAYYAPNKGIQKTKLLPPLDEYGDVQNPVVHRALSQMRKVVNSVIRRYGPMTEIHVELARDLRKSFQERKYIEKLRKENSNERERIIEDMQNTFPAFRNNPPKGRDILKYRLCKEQNYECAYSGTSFDRHRLFEDNYAEIDHILPYSRTFDDSYTNKVLVLYEENRNKGNRTPYEYMSGNPERWARFCGWAESTIRNGKKLRNLLRTKLAPEISETPDETWKDRNLNDTRYITRFTSSWLREGLIFAEGARKNPVLATQGRFTSMLRDRWELEKLKNRDENDLHHALDAAVVAAVSHKMIQRVAQYSQSEELNRVRVEPSGARRRNSFPEPWPGFRHEIKIFVSEDPQKAMEKISLNDKYSEEEKNAIRPIFVSRAPRRKATGEIHEETIRSIKPRPGHGMRGCVSKIKLENLKLNDLESMVGKDRDRRLYEALKMRLEEFNGDGKTAFAEPFYKPTTDGRQGPVVRTIKVYSNMRSGIEVRGGLAKNGEVVRVDVYRKEGKYFLVPHYIVDIALRILKKKAILAYKDEKDWTQIDESYDFCFSLFKNDLVRVVDSSNAELFGYYQMVHRSTGAITIEAHDSSWVRNGIGVKTCALFEKYQVTPLGDYHKINGEKRPETVRG